jgi:hypothetical protein
MFELVEYRTIPSPQPSIEGALPGAVYQASLAQVQQTMPAFWQGRSLRAQWGLLTTVTVRMQPAQGGTAVQVQIGAELDTTSIVILVVCVLLFWPVAAVLGYMGYDDFQKRRTAIMYAIWQNLGAGPPPGPPSPFGVAPPPGGFSGQYG